MPLCPIEQEALRAIAPADGAADAVVELPERDVVLGVVVADGEPVAVGLDVEEDAGRAIRRADEDGNPLTIQDAAWTPLFSAPPYLTPPIPDYPSNHTVVGAAVAEVLVHFFGDAVLFTTTSSSLAGVSRSFRGFRMAAVENGLSRAYAGIHFLRAIADGYLQGQRIGRTVTGLLPRAH